MPLVQGKSKEAFKHNVKAEISAGKPLKQSLAIAYNTKKHMMKNKKSLGGLADDASPQFSRDTAEDADMDAKADYPEGSKLQNYAKGGEVENESLHPDNEPTDSLATSDIDHLRLGSMAQDHEDMPEPSEPKRHVDPAEVNMGRSAGLEFSDRIKRAVRMAMGGSVDEQDGLQTNSTRNGGGESLDQDEMSERSLAMNDTYPPGKAESDTQAQDEMFGDYNPAEGGVGNDDQESGRRNWQQTAKNMAMGGGVPTAETPDLNKQPRSGQAPMVDYNEEGMVDQDEARKGRLQRALDEVMTFHRNPRTPFERPARISNSNTPVPSGTQRMSNRPHPDKKKQP
jgi:hypothetical protein